MKGEWVAAERVEEVRAAARGWKTAGAVSEGTFDEISRRYPEPRTLPALLWRVLFFVLASFVLLSFSAALLAGFSPSSSDAWILCAVLGMAFMAGAEMQARSPAMALRGGVGAASFWGIVSLVAGLFFLFEENLHISEPEGPNLVLAATAALFAGAAWRWGIAVFAGLSAVAFFVLLARAPQGRLLWIAAGVALSALAERFADRPAWAPSHRSSAAFLVVVGIGALYAAVNFWSVDHHAIEGWRGRSWGLGEPSDFVRVAAILATVLLPLAVLARAIARRSTVLLDTGLVLVALSLVTLRAYVHLADLWAVLTGAGALLVGAALAVHRWLERGPHGERHGFTADALFGDAERLRALELVPVLAAHAQAADAPATHAPPTHAPAAHAPAANPPDEPGYSGRGGSFGGGGAGSSW